MGTFLQVSSQPGIREWRKYLIPCLLAKPSLPSKMLGGIMRLGAKTTKDNKYKHSRYKGESTPCATTFLRKPHNQKCKEESYLRTTKTEGPY
jgi:hypothetical protein